MRSNSFHLALIVLCVQLPAIAQTTQKNYTEQVPDTQIQFDMIAVPAGSS